MCIKYRNKQSDHHVLALTGVLLKGLSSRGTTSLSSKIHVYSSISRNLTCLINVMIGVLFARKVRTFQEIEVSVLMFFSYPGLVVWYLAFFYLCV